MSEKKQQLLPPSGSRLPATVRSIKPSLPSLPSDSGKWFGSPSTLLDADRRYVEISAAYLRARGDQATAMAELVSAREDLALAISRLHALPERCAHEYEKGRLTRLSELRMLDLKCQTDELNAQSMLAAAQRYLASFEPAPPDPPAPAAPATVAGLTVGDVEQVAQQFPELNPETIRTLSLALSGLLAEKKK